MEVWTERLRTRRTEILARLAEIGIPKVGTRGFAERPSLNQELVTIEQTLAQVESTEALRRDTLEREIERLKQDDSSYWSRRFHTSLAIGNGAGFALVTGALLQSQQVDQALVFAWPSMSFFGPGLVFAGALPWLLWAQRHFSERPRVRGAAGLATTLLTTLSAGCFVVAIGMSVYTVTSLQGAAGEMARAQRAVEGAELAKRWEATGLPRPSSGER
jgi:hypothetical protein